MEGYSIHRFLKKNINIKKFSYKYRFRLQLESFQMVLFDFQRLYRLIDFFKIEKLCESNLTSLRTFQNV